MENQIDYLIEQPVVTPLSHWKCGGPKLAFHGSNWNQIGSIFVFVFIIVFVYKNQVFLRYFFRWKKLGFILMTKMAKEYERNLFLNKMFV